jgi:two-component system LytT family response regulator
MNPLREPLPADGPRVHARREPWKLHLVFWLVMGAALFVSGVSQGPVTISLIRNLYLLVAGFLAGFFLSWVLQRAAERPLGQRLTLALVCATVLGFLIVLAVNPITFGQFGIAVGDLTARHLFAGAMNYVLVLSLWGALFLLFERRDAAEPAAAPAVPVEPEAAPLVVESRGIVRSLDLADVEHLEAAGDYVRVHTREGVFLKRTTLSALEELLPAARFLRIHRSRIVNAERVRALEPGSKGSHVVVLAGGARLRASRGHRDALAQRFRRS